MDIYEKPLFIYEMANNHQGSVEHGKRIIRELEEVSRPYRERFHFAFKFQYRDLDTFIHPAYRDRSDIKNVKRFQDTRLNRDQFQELLTEARSRGFYTVCTPFDEPSADLIVEQDYDVIKIASCSFTDWSLLEKIGKCGKPVIASAAGSSLSDMEKVVNFFKNRHIDFSLMHCIAEYPAAGEVLQMNQIDFYRNRFRNVRIGFSTHEDPDNYDPVKIAVAKGAVIFEKHVGVPADHIVLNAYSASPNQVGKWLEAAAAAFDMCGVSGRRYAPSEKEKSDLASLQRGVFARRTIAPGVKIGKEDVYLAFPCTEGQVLASHLSKYTELHNGAQSIAADHPVMLEQVEQKDNYKNVRDIIEQVMDILQKSNVVIPVNSTCELSHHYGIEHFQETGVTMINCINREYCKKILVVLPGQSHPKHMHRQKEETFTVLYGELETDCDGQVSVVGQGESMVVERGVNHSFRSRNGCVFEEISTTHFQDDSFYEKEDFVSPRKTEIYVTKEMLDAWKKSKV